MKRKVFQTDVCLGLDLFETHGPDQEMDDDGRQVLIQSMIQNGLLYQCLVGLSRKRVVLILQRLRK
ncbi:hypothetical protein CHS0354_019541 [Potamilus streckersoni]|uniref:Uncharacterized protein n=1 Tax=Potamilus streckersoni TaxID=2493646 RepID=A0AAE0SHG1_9BIVA|nr:hypothetical protein CHS0354_019541 [Potamilus streckersoni]